MGLDGQARRSERGRGADGAVPGLIVHIATTRDKGTGYDDLVCYPKSPNILETIARSHVVLRPFGVTKVEAGPGAPNFLTTVRSSPLLLRLSSPLSRVP
jgi:hypothetical protein